MAGADLGRAVLELATDGRAYSKGLSDARHEADSWGDRVGGVAKAASLAFVGMGLAGIGATVGFIKAAADEEAGIQRLAQAIRNTGTPSVQDYQDAWESALPAMERTTAFSDGEMRDALSMLVSLTGDADEAWRRLPVAMDLARGAHIDLETASRLLGKVTDENVTVLKRYGITVKDGADATDLLAAVQQKFGGQSESFAKTAVGQWTIFKITLGDLAEDIGAILLPKATAALGFLITTVSWVRELAAIITGKLAPEAWSLNKLVGEDRGALILGVIQSVVRGITSLPGLVGNVMGSLGEMFDVISGRNPAAGGVLRQLVGDERATQIMSVLGTVRDAITQAFDFIRPVIQGAIDKVQELYDKFRSLPEPLQAAFAGAAVASITGTSDAIFGVGASLATMASGLINVGGLVPGLMKQLALLPTAFGLLGISIGEAAAATGAFMLAALPFVALGAAIAVLIYLLVTHWSELGDTIGMVGQIIGYFAGQAAATIGNFFSGVGSAVQGFLGFWLGVWQEISSRPGYYLGLLIGFVFGELLNLAQGIADFAGGVLATLKGWGSALLEGIQNVLAVLGQAWSAFWSGEMLNALLDGIGALMANLLEWGGNFLSWLGGIASDAITTWFDFWLQLPSRMVSIGHDIVLGVWDGISGMAGWFASQVQGFFSGIVDGVKRALGIGSPSKVFASIGRDMVAGLNVGLDGANAIGGSVAADVTAGAVRAARESGPAEGHGHPIVLDGRVVGGLLGDRIVRGTALAGGAIG